MGSILSFISRCFPSIFRSSTDSDGHEPFRDPDLEEGKSSDTVIGPTSAPTVKVRRRALLVGISYAHSQSEWCSLENPHQDVDMFRDLLIGE